SFLFIDDCLNAVRAFMKSEEEGPFNIGSEEMISINDYAKMIAEISGKTIHLKNIEGPTGVRGRCSDNTVIEDKLGWKPTLDLREGTMRTFSWINDQQKKSINAK
ncbi:MAG: GDP-D-mannose 3',5'-epimerase, partial [Bacteroidia bacterium]